MSFFFFAIYYKQKQIPRNISAIVDTEIIAVVFCALQKGRLIPAAI